MPAITSRDLAGPADFRAMQALAQQVWSVNQRFHAGALAWERYEHTGRESDWPTRLWFESDRLVAWAWLYERDPDVLYVLVHPDHLALLDEALGWFDAVSTATAQECLVFEPERPLGEHLAARGFAPDPDAPFGLSTRRDLVEPPPLRLPAGHRIRTMADAPDPDRRATAHRAAWD